MSFSADLKLELSEIQPHAQHCRIAELAGLVSLLGKYFDKKIKKRLIYMCKAKAIRKSHPYWRHAMQMYLSSIQLNKRDLIG